MWELNKIKISFINSLAGRRRAGPDSKEVLEINKELVDLSQTTMPNNYQSVESIMALEYSSADINRAIYISTDLYNLYNSNDYRRRNRFYTSEGSGRYTVRKGGSNEYACTFRTGEIYLNAAEAACQDDNLIDAKDYLLQLKAKRFNATGYAEEETKVEAMDKDLCNLQKYNKFLKREN